MEVAQLAANLARANGYAVFPVKEDKRPACPHGFEMAVKDRVAVRELWRRWPGPLIGIATGTVSNVWVLDIDAQHATAARWWRENFPRLLPTRCYQTRSGGLHCYFTGGGEQRNSAGRPVKGVDVRGNGGYVVSWTASGLECLDHAPPAPWPAWLTEAVAPATQCHTVPHTPEGALRPEGDGWLSGILDTLEAAQQGERNALLFWSACRLFERGLRVRDIERLLLPAAVGLGLADHEARKTIASAGRR